MKTAIIAGATGLVGGELLQLLLNSTEYQKVISISRKDIGIQHPNLLQVIIDFETLCEHRATVKGDVLFLCLGTTKQQTPDKATYRKIEHLYPLLLASAAKNNGVGQIHFVSSVGADVKASGFYLQLKGETEYELEKLNIKSLHIYRPSLLTGARKENRTMEDLAAAVMRVADPLLVGSLKKYKSIAAATVAKAMYKKSLNTEAGVFIHPSDHIQNIA